MATVAINATVDGDNPLILAPGAGLRIRVLTLILTGQTTAGTAIVRSGAAGTIHGRFALGIATNGVAIAGTVDNPPFDCDANASLVCNNSAGLDVLGMVTYIVINA